jgi:D-alanyl-D-alanine carboxypeptidase
MFKRGFGALRGTKSERVLLASLALLFISVMHSPADARHRHHARHKNHSHHARVANDLAAYSPGFAAIVVDANSGKTLYGRNENELRHPASVTKVMTLYLLFEQLEKGRFQLDSELTISAHAAVQAPTKLGLRPGRTIEVEDAIKAVVTKSANDIAVAIAEAIGGDEETFASMMTRKARALGMSRTVYRNASGLPNSDQVTTAHDLAILGRSIQERFPRYYRYFSTRVFQYAGRAHPNHNHLLGQIEGMDGIKTGYTRASGFNLLSSVKRDGHHIISVVLGGKSAAGRDRIMANLIEDQIDNSATVRAATMVAENDTADRISDVARGAKPAEPKASDVKVVPVKLAELRPEPTKELGKPMPLRPEPTPAPASVQVASLNPVAITPEKPRPAFVSGAPKPTPVDERQLTTSSINSRQSSLDGSTARPLAYAAPTATPSNMRWIVGPQGNRANAVVASDAQKLNKPAGKQEVTKPEIAKADSGKTDTRKALETGRPAAAQSGWMIQIGATDDIGKANDLLARAKTQGHSALGTAQAFTEKVQKGSETLYRARFAGLAADNAEAACKTLKRAGFSCFATRN